MRLLSLLSLFFQFGEVGVDDALVKERFETTEDIFEMNNGCICCTVRGDLIRILSKLFRRGSALDAIVIETTGLADPGPVAQTFFMDESIKEFARLDGIVTLVDCKHIEQVPRVCRRRAFLFYSIAHTRSCAAVAAPRRGEAGGRRERGGRAGRLRRPPDLKQDGPRT